MKFNTLIIIYEFILPPTPPKVNINQLKNLMKLNILFKNINNICILNHSHAELK